MERVVFPFAAVLGQETVKKALLWNLVNPDIGGVLISGEKGTAKSTLVRGLAALSEDMRLVELPLNVTEDRLVGSIDLKKALLFGESVLEPGILKEADGNLLYVDEVNLLSDHIVNVLLETAANKRNVVEREGVSCVHDCRFVLIGSMNQEEGKLRSQFLDRFGLYVEVEGEKDRPTRVEIMRRRLEFEKDPIHFLNSYKEETKGLRQKIMKAKELLAKVEITENALKLASTLSANANCRGHRGELAVIQTARAIAAMDGRRMMNTEDIKEAAQYALAHRMTELSYAQEPSDMDADDENRQEEQDSPEPDAREQDAMEQDSMEPELSEAESQEEESRKEEQAQAEEEKAESEKDSGEQNPRDGEPQKNRQPDSSRPDAGQDFGNQENGEEDVEECGEAFLIPQWKEAPSKARVSQGAGRRNLVKSDNRQGRYVRYRTAGEEKVTDLAFDATVRAAAPFQRLRNRSGRVIAIEKSDMRIKVREKRTGGCILFVVDASASMGANRRMKEVKAAILSLLNVSYQKRDRVGLIAFRKNQAELLLGITRSVELAQKKLAQLPTGGKTPLAKGLDLAYEVVMGLKMREPEAQPTIVLVSDGRASGKKEKNSNPFADALRSAKRIGNQKINTIILDTENDFIRFHLCAELNKELNGILLTMEELKSEGIVEAVNAYGNPNR